MKKIISLLLTFMLVFSLAFAMTSCDNGEISSGDNSSSDGNGSSGGSDDTGNDNTDGGDNTGTGSGDTGSTGGSDNTGDDNTGSGDTGSDDNTGSGDDSNTGDTDSDAKKLVGIAKNVDDFSHDQSSKLTLRLEADTETVVYVLLSSEVENLSLLINVYPGSSVITADLTVDDYDERLGVYVAKITIPASEQNTTYEAHLCIDGEKIGEKFRISIPKVEYVDPNGSNPV